MNLVILKPFDVDLVVILIFLIFVFYSQTGAGIFAFGQGLITDIFSGGMLGLFTITYLIVFFGIKLASRPLDLSSYGGQFLIISTAVVFKDAMMVFLLYLFSLEVSLSYVNILSFIVSATFSGLIAPFFFYLAKYLSNVFMGKDNEI
jgi:rod shape-determining protein MreD